MALGDSNGETAVYNCLNGAIIKRLPKHQAEVIKILHIPIPSAEKFVTASMDNTIIISDDTKINEADLIRSIVLNDVYASCLFFEPK